MPKFITRIEIDVVVDYYVEPGQKGTTDSMGAPEEPSWEPYVESVEGVSIGGKSSDIQAMLSENEQKDVFEQAVEHFEERDEQ